MGELIRKYDWNAAALGDPSEWPQGLKTAVRLLLSTRHPVFIWWGPQLIQLYNDAYRRSIGPERHPGALGQPGRECWLEIWHVIGPQIEQVMAGGSATWHENQLIPITRNGRREDVYWTYSYSPIDEPTVPSGVGGVLVVCTETTDQILAERRFQAAEARWRSMFDQSPSFACILDGPDHVFEYANERYLHLLDARDVTGRRARDVVPEVAAQAFIGQLDQVFRSGERHEGFASPLVLNGGGGEPRYLDFVYQPIRDGAGLVTGVLVQGSDVTERVASHRALEEADRRKDEFLAMLAHELRNPLAPIRTASEILVGEASADAHKVAAGIVRRQTAHLTRLVDDLIDVSRVAHGRIALRLQVLELAAVIAQAVEAVEASVREKRQRLRVAPPGRPVLVRADQDRLVQCVTNVLANAVRYTPEGGQISVEARAVGEEAIIEVIDDGIGIPPELLPRIFDLFVQGRRNLDRAQGGLGIGLAIVKRLVELHGGAITAASPGQGKGSRFTLTIPRVDSAAAEAESAVAPQGGARRILVVDDNIDAADSLCLLLRLAGHETRAAYTSADALEQVVAFAPDTALLDIGLPEMDGFELARRIRAGARPPRLIALTGYGRPEDRKLALAAGFDAHLVKPVELDALRKALEVQGPPAA